MTRTCRLMLCMVFMLGLAASLSAQSLGDVARKERAKQKPQSAKTYTNEEIPGVEIPKEEPKAADATAAASTVVGADADKKDGAKDTKAAAKPEKTDAEKQAALNAEWKAKVEESKKNVASIEREINLMQREEKLKVAVYYSDAGNRLRDDKAWAEQEKKYQDDLAARQKDLSGAKEKLNGVLDAAKKAGATSVE